MNLRTDVSAHREALRRLVQSRIAEVQAAGGRLAELALLRADLAYVGEPCFAICQDCAAAIDFSHLLVDPGMRHCARCGQHFFWEQDENYRFVLRVGSARESQPYPAERVIGKTRWELPTLNLTADDWAKHRADLEARREFRDLLISRPAPSGKPRWIRVTGRPVFDDEGRFTGYRGYAREVPEPPGI
jgi:PAS domain-containing protein